MSAPPAPPPYSDHASDWPTPLSVCKKAHLSSGTQGNWFAERVHSPGRAPQSVRFLQPKCPGSEKMKMKMKGVRLASSRFLLLTLPLTHSPRLSCALAELGLVCARLTGRICDLATNRDAFGCVRFFAFFTVTIECFFGGGLRGGLFASSTMWTSSRSATCSG